MKGIIFGTESIQALRDGRQTMTRRIVKKVYKWIKKVEKNNDGTFTFYPSGHGIIGNLAYTLKPRYQPGDVCYVKETWYAHDCTANECILSDYYDCPNVTHTKKGVCYIYKASHENDVDVKWRSPLCMPKEAARYFIRIKDVRVERLQDITEEDAKAEGVEWLSEISAFKNYLWHGNHDAPQKLIDLWKYQYSSYDNARDSYSSLWQLKNARNGHDWDKNDWVFVYTFEKIRNEEAERLEGMKC